MNKFKIITVNELNNPEVHQRKSTLPGMSEVRNFLLGGCLQNKKESNLRNKIDGSFIVTLDVLPIFGERLVADILKLADKEGLTISPNVITEVYIGTSLVFGCSEYYDVVVADTSNMNGITKAFNEGLFPVFRLSTDLSKIKTSIIEMGKEYRKLVNDDLRNVFTANKPITPTYATLKGATINRKLVEEKKHEALVKEYSSPRKVLRENNDSLRIVVTNDFIKIGYNFIPINDNQTVHISV